MSYATVDEYRARVRSTRAATTAQDDVIQDALDAAQSQIHEATKRRFDSTTATRTLKVLGGQVFLPDLLDATTVEWAPDVFSTFSSMTYHLDDADPHRRMKIKTGVGYVQVTGDWGFDPTPDAIKSLEIDIAAGLLVDGPRATGQVAGVTEDTAVSLQVDVAKIMAAWRDDVQYT